MPATPPDTTYPYDVFISYSHADADWVWNWLVPRLKAEGLAVCTDQESFDLGVPSLINMENAVAASRHTLLVLTPAYVQSQWTLYEQILTQTQDPIGLRQRTLPVLRQPCELPTRIAMLTYVNLGEGAAVEREFGRLVSAIRGVRHLPAPLSVSVGGPMVVTTSVVPAASPIPPPAFNTAVVRELLMAAFNDSELTTLCFDYFRPAHEQFADGMNRTQKTQILVEHCERRGRMEELLAEIERVNPYQFGQFKARLRNDNPSPGPKPGPNPPLYPSAGVISAKGPIRSVSHKTGQKRLRKLPMAESIEADRKARSGEKVVEPPKEPEPPKEEPKKDEPKRFFDGPQPPDSWKSEEKPEEPPKEELEKKDNQIIDGPVAGPETNTETTNPPPKGGKLAWLLIGAIVIGIVVIIVSGQYGNQQSVYPTPTFAGFPTSDASRRESVDPPWPKKTTPSPTGVEPTPARPKEDWYRCTISGYTETWSYKQIFVDSAGNRWFCQIPLEPTPGVTHGWRLMADGE